MSRTIVDSSALAKNRLRAVQQSAQGADFLLKVVAEDLSARLSTIRRSFDTVAVLNEPGMHILNMLRSLPSIAPTICSSKPKEYAGHGEFEVISADDLVPFKNGSFDLVLSVLTGQFINDLPGLFIQVKRTLKADGLFLATFLGGKTLQELRAVLLEAEAEITGTVHSRVLPFVDVREAGGLLQRAGFALPVTDTDPLTVRYRDVYHLMHDLRAMGAQNPAADRSRKFLSRRVFELANQLYQERYSDSDGRIRATFELISVSGWAPHESQQKPLKPGSAKISLAEVLPNKHKPR